MSEVESDKLSARLHQAVDDHPVDVPDLLTPARSRRTRRRVLGGTAAVAVVVAGALALSQLLSSTPHTALVAATATATPAVTTPNATRSSEVLDNATIVARCAAQMVKYESMIHTDSYTPFPTPADGWMVAHQALAYHEGDIVGLVERGRVSWAMALCRIPAAGQENVDVPFTAFDPSTLDEAGRVMRCSEELTNRVLSPTPGTDVYATTDLRGSAVVASDTTDRAGLLMLRLGSADYLCSLLPAELLGTGNVFPARAEIREMKPYLVGEAMLDSSGSYFTAAGWLPANAASIEFSVKGIVHRVTPASDGSWVAVWKVVGVATMNDATYTTRSASGAVLATGSMN
jgi:hypothetical protein